MSQLAQLKQALSSVATSAKQAGSNLASFDRTFSQQAAQVQQTIGGSAQRKDAEITAALPEATKAVKQASQALQRAAQAASQYTQAL